MPLKNAKEERFIEMKSQNKRKIHCGKKLIIKELTLSVRPYNAL